MRETLLLIFTLINFSLFGQVLINDTTFPSVGDTIFSSVAVNPQIDLKIDASGQTSWDFSSLIANNETTTLILEPSASTSGELYPNAELLISQQGLEFFYDVRSDKIVEIGAVGPDPVLGLLDIAYKYDGERVYRRAPVAYGDEFVDDYSLKITEAIESLPEEIRTQISQLGLDSIRLETIVSENTVAEAYGTLTMPDASYEVLRVKNTNYIQSDVYAYQEFAGWVHLPPSSIEIDGVEDLLTTDTVVLYNFYANDEIQPIAQVTVDNESNEPTSITYKRDDLMTSTTDITATKSLNTYPNPTFGDITFELSNYPKDNYRVDIYNIIGKKLDTKYFEARSTKLTTNLSNLRKGTYLYSIVNSAGKKMVTKRLIIITP